MRRKYIAQGDKWVEVKPTQKTLSYTVMGDIEPYQSMITGETITSRSKHRQHLKDHECIEVGNDYHKQLTAYDNPKDTNPKGRHELIKEQVMSIPDDKFRKMLYQECLKLKGG